VEDGSGTALAATVVPVHRTYGAAGALCLASGAVLSLVLLYAVLLLEPATVRRLTTEDGPVETLAAVSALVSAILFLFAYATAPGGNDLFVWRTRRNVFFLLLGLLFLFGAGEEVSWGQRIFDIPTPEPLRVYNMQGELNLHNLAPVHGDTPRTGVRYWLTVEKLFAVFWFGFCVLMPLLARVSRPVGRLVLRVNLPVVPLWLGLLFPLSYMIAKLFEARLGDSDLLGPLSEVKETSLLLIFVCIAIHFLLVSRHTPGEMREVAARIRS
jgi:hypothetical protein